MVLSDKCFCDMGYWGLICINECLGGYWFLCNKYGICDEVMGICFC